MLILGVDPGLSCTAWALAQPGDPKPRIIKAGVIKITDEPDKLLRALRIASYTALQYSQVLIGARVAVVIERAPAMYSTRPRGAADSDLNFLIGAIAYAIYDRNPNPPMLTFVYPATWRTQVLGAANIQPDKATICSVFDVLDPKAMLANPDLRDAVCIAGWGARTIQA